MLILLLICVLVTLLFIANELSRLRTQVEGISQAMCCRRCNGSGRASDLEPDEKCADCGGSGYITGEMVKWLGRIGNVHATILELWACPDCLGAGWRPGGNDLSQRNTCETCHGTGLRQRSPDLKES